MRTPTYVKPALWGAAAGAVTTMVVGFSAMDWKTAGSAERGAATRAGEAVVTALVPFCVAKAEFDGVKLAQFKAETSPYKRGEMVRDAGWASLYGDKSPDHALSRACSERLSTKIAAS